LGDANTRGDVFESINFRGLQFSSDEAQLPIGLQSYAPVIRGTARSNALVEIRQNNYLVYSMNVAPGNFEIADLSGVNDSGDLEIKIIESDGSVRTYTQPYASIPNMVRAGQHKYQITAGQYRSGSGAELPYFGQLTYTLGFNNFLTPYVGVLAADYHSVAGGTAWSLGNWGAVSADLSYARNTLFSGRQEDGLAVRVNYAKSINTLGTDIHLTGSHYSEQYFSFADAVQEKRSGRMARISISTKTHRQSMTPQILLIFKHSPIIRLCFSIEKLSIKFH
jgi:outer membrane usher protein